MAKSKFFRVAVEGATTDGREIQRDWITQMAATYNRAKYGARVFAEHIRGMVPDGPFRAFGDVLALKAEEITDGDLKGKMALYAQIEPSDDMIKLIRSGQKVYSSIEIDANFTGSRLAYLTGLGITDSPASLGTEVLTFAAQHPDANPFRTRKQRPENLFSAALESDIELEEETTENDDPSAGFFGKLSALLDKFSAASPTKPSTAPEPPEETTGFASDLGDLVDALSKFSAATQNEMKGLAAAVKQHQNETERALTEFRSVLDNTVAPNQGRAPVTGGPGTTLTDC